MKGYIYLIERSDGLKYIGITTNLEKRLKEHSNSQRFDIGILHVQTLFIGTYSECQELEPVFIAKHDTYLNGLNITKDGRGKCKSTKFNTLGIPMSENTKEKISRKAKLRVGIKNPMFGKKHSIESKNKMSETRKGKRWSPPKISDSLVIKIRQDFDLEKLQLENLIKISKNGKKITVERLFAKKYHNKYSLTENGLWQIVANKTRINVID